MPETELGGHEAESGLITPSHPRPLREYGHSIVECAEAEADKESKVWVVCQRADIFARLSLTVTSRDFIIIRVSEFVTTYTVRICFVSFVSFKVRNYCLINPKC